MPFINSSVGYVDLNFRGVPGVIGTGVLSTADGITLIDPGPTSCLDGLASGLRGLGFDITDVTRVLLTHIHLDHAGSSGTLLERRPGIEVYVHEQGAKHLIAPAKLVSSATRLFGSGMSDWGEMLPVPSKNIRVLNGGERLHIGGHEFLIEYTPGHASHHVSYFDSTDEIAWVGDTGGVRVGETNFVLPPTPPPDIDLEQWYESLGRIRSWFAKRLFITHFGLIESVQNHLDCLHQSLRDLGEIARQSVAAAAQPDRQYAAYSDAFHKYVQGILPGNDLSAFETAAPLQYNWQGLSRYWTRKLPQSSGS